MNRQVVTETVDGEPFAPDSADYSEEDRIRAHQIQTVLSASPKNLIAGIIAATVLSVGTQFWQISEPLLSLQWMWLVAISLGLLYGIWISATYNARHNSVAETFRMGRRLQLNGILCGAIWGMSGWAILPYLDTDGQAIATLFIAMILMGGAATQAVYRSHVTSFTVSLSAAFLLGLFRFWDQYHFTIAVGFSMLSWAVLASARTQEQALKDTIRLGYEKERIKDEMRRRAELQSEEKSRFLASASHDLRQPMQAMDNFIAAAGMAMDHKDLDSARTWLNRAGDSVDLLRRTFRDVLDISKLDAGVLKPETSTFSVGALVRDIESTFRDLSRDENVELRIFQLANNQELLIRSDQSLLYRIVGNLISNAIRYSNQYSERGAFVFMGTARVGNRLRIDIRDNGIGISQEHIGRIFSPFYRINDTGHAEEKGLGLGLSIVRGMIDLLERHELAVSSRIGKGTRFSVYVPIATIQVPLQSLKDANAKETAAGAYVVLVEDDREVRESLVAVFSQSGIICEPAESWEAAVGLLRNSEMPPDVVVTDYRLGDGKTGVDVIHSAAEILGYPIPGIIVTGELNIPGSVETLDNIVILRKPLNPKLLISAIASCRMEDGFMAGSR